MDTVESAIRNIFLLAASAALVYWATEWVRNAIARFRYRRSANRTQRKHADKLENCKAVIRDYEPGDEAAVFALIRENAAHEGVQLDADWPSYWLRAPAIVANLSVAVADKRVVGYAHWQVHLFGFHRTAANMTELYVRPEYRRQGIGSALVAQVVKQAGTFGYEAVNYVFGPQDEPASGFFHMVGALPSAMFHCLVPVPPADIVKGGPEPVDDSPITVESPSASQMLH